MSQKTGTYEISKRAAGNEPLYIWRGEEFLAKLHDMTDRAHRLTGINLILLVRNNAKRQERVGDMLHLDHPALKVVERADVFDLQAIRTYLIEQKILEEV